MNTTVGDEGVEEICLDPASVEGKEFLFTLEEAFETTAITGRITEAKVYSGGITLHVDERQVFHKHVLKYILYDRPIGVWFAIVVSRDDSQRDLSIKGTLSY